MGIYKLRRMRSELNSRQLMVRWFDYVGWRSLNACSFVSGVPCPRADITIAITCFLSIALLLLLCGHKETFVLVVIAPVCVLLNDLPLPRWTAPKLDISFGVYLYPLPIGI